MKIKVNWPDTIAFLTGIAMFIFLTGYGVGAAIYGN